MLTLIPGAPSVARYPEMDCVEKQIDQERLRGQDPEGQRNHSLAGQAPPDTEKASAVPAECGVVVGEKPLPPQGPGSISLQGTFLLLSVVNISAHYR